MSKKEKLKESGVIGIYASDLPKDSQEEIQQAINALLKNIHERPPFAKEIAAYRKYVPVLLRYTEFLDKVSQHTSQTFKRLVDDSEEKKYQRWSEVEDEVLIELACREDVSMLEMSTAMGRSVPAIKSRLTKLVGIKRLSQEVAGRFIGTINGNHADCVVDGTIYKAE